MTIREWCEDAHRTAVEHGWVWDESKTLEKLMLIVTEVAEAAEDYRNSRMDHFPEELADICIRVFDMAWVLGIDLEEAIEKKSEVNRTRPWRHGGKRA